MIQYLYWCAWSRLSIKLHNVVLIYYGVDSMLRYYSIYVFHLLVEANTDDTNYMLPIVEQAQQEIFNLTERISSIRSKSFQEFDLERDLAKLNGFLVLLKQVESER